MARRPNFHSVAIIGTGLIGTSIGLALKERAPSLYVVGWDKRAAHARIARKRKAIDALARSMREAASAADCIVLAAPLENILRQLQSIVRYAKPGSFIIDVSGLKTPVDKAAQKALRSRQDVFFAGGHPLAGSELAGPERGSAKLFRDRPFAVCIPARNDRLATASEQKAREFAAMLGARPVLIGAREHDRTVAATSALPQLIAVCTSLAVAACKPASSLVGPGYEGMTRLALSPFAGWQSGLAFNARNIRRALAVFEMQVRKLRRAMEKRDNRALRRLFAAAASVRRSTMTA